jgi:uncharacterized protein
MAAELSPESAAPPARAPLAPGRTRREVIQGGGAVVLAAAAQMAWTAVLGDEGAQSSQPFDHFDAARAQGRMGARPIREIETAWVPMRDGIRIALRIILPEDAESSPVPAILEYIPYRRRDGTRIRDDQRNFYFASHGYACIRPDIRGSGDSEGVLKDEYLSQEQTDGLEIIAWVARQPWCTGKVGMVGISWGGFSSLQVAARRPPALKAIITHCSTDDRYTDDAHYLGGSIVQDMFGWGSEFLTLQAYPPDPAIVGERWQAMWKARCESMDFSVATWIRHQTRDAFWKHGSVDENYGDIACPVYAIGGWTDAYTNSIPRLMAHLKVPRKALIGPWGHNYPNNGVPGPAIDYLDEARRWWDHWLKGTPTGIMGEPMYRVWIEESAARRGETEIPGRWVAEETWPSARISRETWFLNEDGLATRSGREVARTLEPAQTIGIDAGHWCPFAMATELPLEQRFDDVRSLTFDSASLPARLELLGFPEVELDLSVDKPVAQIAVRLNEVEPDGASHKMTYGVLNLTHRDGHEHPDALEPGKRYRVRLTLKNCGLAFKPGNRLRVAVSTNYWPLLWPAPEPVTLTLYTGASKLILPVRPGRAADEQLPAFGKAFSAPDSGMTELKPNIEPTKRFEWDTRTSTLTITSEGGGGARRFDAIGTVVSESWKEISHIRDDDPTSARLSYWRKHTFTRDAWQVQIESTIDVSANKEQYFVNGGIKTFDHDQPFFARTWNETIPRVLS